MSKMDRDDMLSREESQRLKGRKEMKTKPLKKKAVVREITHYFNKMEKNVSINKNIPTPDKAAIEEMDIQLEKLQEEETQLLSQLEQLKARRQRGKDEAETFMSKSKTIIGTEMRRIAEIQRFFKSQGIERVRTKEANIKQKEESIQYNRISLTNHTLNPCERYFLQKQYQREKTDLASMKLQLQLQRQKLRLSDQQQNCFFMKQNWPLLSKRYQVLELIGKGGFSQVYKAYDNTQNIIVAIKLSSVQHLLSGCSNRNDYIKFIKRQYQIHMGLSHPNIVKLIQVIQLESAICIVLEHCQGMVLSNYLRRHGRIQEKQAKLLIGQILEAVCYLSAQQPAVIHYDLKPQNIVFRQGTLKVLDFGICKTMDGQQSKMALTSQGVGTYYYLPPQTFLNNNPTVSNKVDIWSLGVIFYEMLYGKKPFSHNMTQASFFCSGDMKKTIRFDQDATISDLAKDFITGCLQFQQKKRLDPFSAKNHPYFSQE